MAEQNPPTTDLKGLDPAHQPTQSSQVGANPDQVTAPFDTELKRESLPSVPAGHPASSFTIGAEDAGTTFRAPEAELGKRRVVQAPALVPARAAMNFRVVTADDMDSPGMRAANDSARTYPEGILLRGGERVNTPVEGFDIHDLSTVVTLMPGAVVPEGMTFIPRNYVVEGLRERELAGGARRRR